MHPELHAAFEDREEERRRTIVLLLLVAGVGFVLSLGLGLGQAYLFEHAGYDRVAWRCPMPFPSEQSYDPECMRDLIARGPFVFGRWFLVLSFPLGTAALFLLERIDRSGATSTAALVLLGISTVVGLPLAYWTATGSGVAQTAVVAGLVALLGVAVFARWWNRQAFAVLALLYFAGWIGLLAWNASEARRLSAIG